MESPELAPPLFLAALAAGLVDSIAGGGGLIAIPALLWAGLGPVETLATNKAQAVFGSGTAAVNFARQGAIDLGSVRLALACTFAGAALRAISVRWLDPGLLGGLIPVLLIAFALYFLISPRVCDLEGHRRIGHSAFALTVGTGVGFYDGFFGPGTGTFFAMAYVSLLGQGLRRATAHSKLLNFASNLAAVLVFLPGGHIHWAFAAVMAVGQSAGAWIGSHLVLRHGAALVRPVLVGSSVLISAKLLWERLG
jgi:uncharacterized membrane protein YfcA